MFVGIERVYVRSCFVGILAWDLRVVAVCVLVAFLFIEYVLRYEYVVGGVFVFFVGRLGFLGFYCYE